MAKVIDMEEQQKIIYEAIDLQVQELKGKLDSLTTDLEAAKE